MHKKLLLILTSFLLYGKIPPPPHPKFVYNEMLFISVLLLNIFYSMQNFSFTINRYGHLLSPFFIPLCLHSLFLSLYLATIYNRQTHILFYWKSSISARMHPCTLSFRMILTTRSALLKNSPTSCRHFPVVPYAGFFIRCGFSPKFADFVYSGTQPMYERYHTVLFF